MTPQHIAATATPTTTTSQGHTLRAVFWVALVLFISWDVWQSPAVDLRFEAPLIAAGSGKAISGGHCSMPSGK
jgi:hypothetical protein